MVGIQVSVCVFPPQGFENLDPARRRLHCVICKERGGACIQCDYTKCTTVRYADQETGGDVLKVVLLAGCSRSTPSARASKAWTWVPCRTRAAQMVNSLEALLTALLTASLSACRACVCHDLVTAHT